MLLTQSQEGYSFNIQCTSHFYHIMSCEIKKGGSNDLGALYVYIKLCHDMVTHNSKHASTKGCKDL